MRKLEHGQKAFLTEFFKPYTTWKRADREAACSNGTPTDYLCVYVNHLSTHLSNLLRTRFIRHSSRVLNHLNFRRNAEVVFWTLDPAPSRDYAEDVWSKGEQNDAPMQQLVQSLPLHSLMNNVDRNQNFTYRTWAIRTRMILMKHI